MRVLARQVRRQNARLLVGRLDKSVADPAVLGAFANREDIGPAGPQAVVDDNSAIDIEAGAVGEFDIRPDAGGDHNKIGFNLRTVFERNSLHAPFADNRSGFGIEENRDATRLDGQFQHPGSMAIELALHEPIHQVHDRDLRASFRQAVGRLKTKQTAADNNNTRVPLRSRLDGGDVGEIAECHDPGQLHARNAQPDRARAGGEHQSANTAGLRRQRALHGELSSRLPSLCARRAK